ncbi:MAG: cyclic nucleotide-binding domain-containing protein [Planctomycetes bacterium]|nr:cyclic nucleotide-binding domain-containing protein [Planctomycetota bacterium]
MSAAREDACRYVVICVDDEPESRAALQRDVAQICGAALEVHACTDAEQVLELAERLSPPAARVPLIIADQVLPGLSGAELLSTLHERRDYRATRKVLLSAGEATVDVRRLLNQGALHRHLAKPCPPDELRHCIRTLLTSYFVHHAPADTERFPELVATEQLPRAFQASRQRQRELDSQVEVLKRSFLAHADLSDDVVEDTLVGAIDEALDNPPRREYPAGTVLLRQDEPVDTVSILTDGYVQLSRRANDHEVILHTHSAGRIIGLLSLAHRQRAFFTCTAAMDITVIPLSLEQLETALQASPWLSGYFVTALIRSLGTRSKRTAQLKVEVENLNRALRQERDELADALRQLEGAQMRLVESEKMATLGQLSAGVAHELNNPVAAIQRAADFVCEDLLTMLEELPDGAAITATLRAALTNEPLSTPEQRQRRTALTQTLHDDALARRLVKVGITTPEEYRARFGRLAGRKRDRALAAAERYSQLGASLRNIASCSRRIAALVKSLRSYARADEAPVANVNLHEGLEDTLLMFGEALRTVELQREYGDLPPLECRVGELNQVWTNLIANALQAMHNQGVLRIETDTPDDAHVRVRVIDSGAGIPPEQLEKVFELNFTTRQGQTGFGLGMGLAICRQIITRHGGTIAMESQPGRTCVTVVLPRHYPQLPGEREAS